ncbi:hypothetical protein NPIL_628381 [Nephila pilipes]|uniref:Uncharacterized protein n=1 Tax=Nephila pilipes TaxID=299642 RepID=A0A8X6QSY7_NEPPI|nr:hypothetical protein NPIL_628381 [Nephila pilipes]
MNHENESLGPFLGLNQSILAASLEKLKSVSEYLSHRTQSEKKLRKFEHEEHLGRNGAKGVSDEQKQRRVDVSREILDQLESEPNFLDDVITGNELWVLQYDSEAKGQRIERLSSNFRESVKVQSKDSTHCHFSTKA